MTSRSPTLRLGDLPAEGRHNATEMKEANVAIKGAVADFVGEIAGMFGEWEEVDPRFILETTLMHLSVQLSQLTDEHKSALGPATQKLRDAWPRVGLSSKALRRPPSSTGRNLRADGIPKRKPYGGGREPRRAPGRSCWICQTVRKVCTDWLVPNGIPKCGVSQISLNNLGCFRQAGPTGWRVPSRSSLRVRRFGRNCTHFASIGELVRDIKTYSLRTRETLRLQGRRRRNPRKNQPMIDGKLCPFALRLTLSIAGQSLRLLC